MDYWHSEENRISIPAHEPDLPKWVWCLVANIRKEGFPDSGPLDSRGGTKHFAPGARVYVLPVRWDGWWDRGPVIGKKKGSRRYVRKIIGWEWLENFRCKRIYSPTVTSWMMGVRSEIKNYGGPYPYGDWIDGWGVPDNYVLGNASYVRKEIQEIVDLYRGGIMERHRAEELAYKEKTKARLKERGIIW